MTNQAAGKYYLDTICPANKLSVPLDAAFQANPVDLQTGKAAAAANRDGLAKSAKELANPAHPWPPLVKEDVDAFVNDLYTDISEADNIAGQANVNGLVAAAKAWKDSGGAAKAQAVRVKLGLPSDARASCGM
ncbi:hypothetical protein [Arthrobacter sp. MMS18-M83]|uniref:hypothetical protein n=1 Tax=Arthrobacter sp. MMS18-M83 TaxID=2996261 RepID=UPI00227A3C29|nr:hypothetical protein [Arthrobacter sp. MMS18-M83]WAH97792.1 hypothetical protein OW521_02515 [Arthrobacter sp. MMS18-M83]